MANEDLSTLDGSDFDLKHRITGAAVLIIFGVLILPWLLGPPNDVATAEQLGEEDVDIQTLTGEVSKSEPELLTFDDVEETVYISKITPLSELNQETELQQSTDQGSNDEPKANGSSDAQENQSANSVSSTTEEDLPSASERESLLQAQLNQEAEQLAQNNSANETANADKIKPVEFIPPKQGEVANKPSDVVEVGWVVQVGLFRDKNRATKLIKDLRRTGFSASSTVVDTNRGANTGTRVWLGPFSKQASAHEELKKLKRVAGKDGFVRVYP